MRQLARLAIALALGLALCAPEASAAMRRRGERGQRPGKGERGAKPTKGQPGMRPGGRTPGARPTPGTRPGAKLAPGRAAPAARPAPRPRPPGGKPGDEDDEGKGSTAFVLQDKDAVVLRDGTRIEGTILCAGQRAVTILIQEPDKVVEKTIPREQVERIIQNADAEFPKEFGIEAVDGHKFLVEAPPEDEEGGGPPAPRGKTKRTARRPPAAKKALKAPRGAPAAQPRTAPKQRRAARPARPAAGAQLDRLPPNVQAILGQLRGKVAVPSDPRALQQLLRRLGRGGALDRMVDPGALDAIRKAAGGR